ncbi:hypothetical protein A4G99_21580 [Haladaptatus sp. R4]|uniref:hypothetical protein n=1 Tax=Haladaptatus sp. R4 TaxID=1679489 RepID=UPI0007B4B635|nr:hypothetical protein [Haladaptatus sp. R4]KZN26390.1 hypothetical protein A4G99_21580 [Haladaptatus sp. R4]
MSRDEQVHGTGIDHVGSDSPPDDSITALGLLVGALRDIRSRPSLAVPFLVTSVVLAACNVVRLRDPVATQVATVARMGLAHFVVLLYPGDSSLVTRPIGAILGLRLPIMAEVAAVWLVTQIAIATAVVALVTRSDGDSISVRSVASLVVFQCCLSGLVWAVGAIAAMLGFVALLVGVLLVAFISARLFAVPVLLVRGSSMGTAIRRSYDSVAGNTLSVVVFAGIIGTLQYWVGSVPMLDSLASYGGPELHVALGTVLGVSIFAPLGVLGAIRVAVIATDE